jgi:opacity protein-like surface antigen
MRHALRFLMCCAIATFLAAPATAADTRWTLRVFAAGHDANLDIMVPAENPDEVRVTSESDLGFGASLEYQFSGPFGVELGIAQASPAIVLSAEVPGYGLLVLSDPMSTRTITLDLNLHLTPGSEYFDVFFGAGAASMSYGDLHYVDPDGDPLDLVVSNDVGFSARAGLDIALGRNSSWAAIGCIRYIWTDLEVRQADEPTSDTATFDFDTFSFSVGIAYSF